MRLVQEQEMDARAPSSPRAKERTPAFVAPPARVFCCPPRCSSCLSFLRLEVYK